MLEYGELEIRAAHGLHEDCLAMIKSHVPEGAKIIDLAAGAGAFSARLVDNGYDVTSNDIDDREWQPNHISKLSLDLDKPLDPFLSPAAYEAVVAMEVIEHLQNPSKLLDDCRRLVARDGVILISTPNVMDLESRLIFLRSGFFFHISPQSYFATGHRTILPCWLLELLIEHAGLEIVEKRWGGQIPSSSTGSIWRALGRRIVRSMALRFIKSPNAQELNAGYVIYVLRVRQNRETEDTA